MTTSLAIANAALLIGLAFLFTGLGSVFFLAALTQFLDDRAERRRRGRL